MKSQASPTAGVIETVNVGPPPPPPPTFPVLLLVSLNPMIAISARPSSALTTATAND